MGKEGYEGMECRSVEGTKGEGIYRFGWNEARTRRSTRESHKGSLSNPLGRLPAFDEKFH